jgi:hypothetical protein
MVDKEIGFTMTTVAGRLKQNSTVQLDRSFRVLLSTCTLPDFSRVAECGRGVSKVPRISA